MYLFAGCFKLVIRLPEGYKGAVAVCEEQLWKSTNLHH